jgi:hypothetical protein
MNGDTEARGSRSHLKAGNSCKRRPECQVADKNPNTHEQTAGALSMMEWLFAREGSIAILFWLV